MTDVWPLLSMEERQRYNELGPAELEAYLPSLRSGSKRKLELTSDLQLVEYY